MQDDLSGASADKSYEAVEKPHHVTLAQSIKPKVEDGFKLTSIGISNEEVDKDDIPEPKPQPKVGHYETA